MGDKKPIYINDIQYFIHLTFSFNILFKTLRKYLIFEKYNPINNKNLSISKRQISCEIVKQIRERYIPRDSKHGTRAMAREFGIAQYTVSQIIRGLRRTKYETD